MAISRDLLMETADVAYKNIEAMAIGPRLAEGGYTEERRLAGLALLQLFLGQREGQAAAKNKRGQLSVQVKAAVGANRSQMMKLRQALRTADRLHNKNYYQELNLTGGVPNNYSSYVPYARRVYHSIVAHADAQAALTGLGFAPAQLNALLADVDAIEELNRQQEQAKGDQADITRQLNATGRQLTADLRTLRNVIKTLYDVEAQAAILSSLRLNQL